MSSLIDYLPVTAFIAVAIFLVKEILEANRRHKSEKRKLQAVKTMLARECEQCNWTIKRLISIFQEVPTKENPKPEGTVDVATYPSGLPYARITTDEGETHTPIPEVKRDLMSKLLLEVATLDEKLFLKLEPAHDAMAEVEHIRTSLLRLDDAHELMGKDGYLEGLAMYALECLEESLAAVGDLYKHCTNEELTKHRLR